MDNQNTCKNCAHFSAHYVKLDTSFLILNEGHCTNDKNTWAFRKKNVAETYCCENWESNICKTELKQEHIKRTLERLSKELSQLIAILKDDEI